MFSISFLPAAAPGAGRALACGLRDGSVVLVDSRQPQRQNGRTMIAHGSRRGGGGGGRGGGGSRYRNVKAGGSRSRFGLGNTDDPGYTTDTLVRLDCSSVDHTHILRDGTRCLIKDRTGGLQTVDLRFFGGQGRGQTGARPLKVLVPPTPGVRLPVPGSFALDPTETIVATPVSTTAAVAAVNGGGGGGGSSSGLPATGMGAAMASGGVGAWGAFSSSSAAALYQQNAATCYRDPSGASHTVNGRWSTNGGCGDGDAGTLFPGRDRLRILDVTSGRVLNDIQTPWTHMSLARGAGATSDGADGNSSGVVKFWGTAREPERGPAVFEARLRSKPNGGYGRL